MCSPEGFSMPHFSIQGLGWPTCFSSVSCCPPSPQKGSHRMLHAAEVRAHGDLPGPGEGPVLETLAHPAPARGALSLPRTSQSMTG